MKPVIELNKATKLYGDTIGIKDISLKVSNGSVFGFLGPNGAGKTTTISMLVDLIRPTSGSIKVFGLDSVNDSLEIRKRIGFLAGDFALDNGLTGWQQLEYFGNLRGNFDRQYVSELAERLNCSLNRKFKTLSRGNKQKVGLISALMHRPELLIFDEPTSGLDPLIQAQFNKIINQHRREGKTAFISSHLLSEVQEICDQVAFIGNGRLLDVKNLDQLTKTTAKHIKIVSASRELPKAVKQLDNVKLQSSRGNTILLKLTGDLNPLIKLLGQYKVKDITIADADLETLFMEYFQDKTDV